jgi:hypothetical protein
MVHGILGRADFFDDRDVKTFMTEFRRAFPDLTVTGAENFVCERNYVVGRWEGWATHTGPAYCDFLVGCLPAASGQKIRFSGTTVLGPH